MLDISHNFPHLKLHSLLSVLISKWKKKLVVEYPYLIIRKAGKEGLLVNLTINFVAQELVVVEKAI